MSTEHQLQKCLTERWINDGVMIDDEPHTLLAWEVMDNYRINDARRGFGRPAIDFLLLDPRGALVAVELKMRVITPRDSWAVLCQVTRRAALLAEEFTIAHLLSAHEACYSGEHGRVGARPALPLATRDPETGVGAVAVTGIPIRRVVAAPVFGKAWPQVLGTFTTATRPEIDAEISRFSTRNWPGTEFRRWLELPTPLSSHVAPGVSALVVNS